MKTVWKVSLCLAATAVLAHAQAAPELKLTISEDSFFSESMLSFQLDSFEREEIWLLQSSVNGADWDDLVYFNGGRNVVGFGVSFARAAITEETILFRARKLAEENPVQRDYLAGLLRWRETGYQDYSFVVSSSQGMVSYEARYTVAAGEVIDVETISIFPPSFEPSADLTIASLFGRVASAIGQDAAVIDVDWNAPNGYPERGFVDRDLSLADEEQSWRILEFIPTSPESDEFLAARQRWRDAAIPDYSFVFGNSSGRGYYEARYTVENGVTTGLEVIGDPPSFITVPPKLTIDDLFQDVAHAFESGADDVDVQWDETVGFPETAAIDFDVRIADEESYWRIKEFVILD